MPATTLPVALKISCLLAVSLTIVVMPIEIVRRWHQLTDPHYFFAWFDDVIMCGLLIFGVWKVYRTTSGQRFLTAGWGFAAGMMYSSFFIQLANQDQPDPSGISVEKVLAFKFFLFSLCVTGFFLSLLTNQIETNK